MNPALAMSAVERPLALTARRDLEVVRVDFSGQGAFVVRDPVTLATTEMSAEEYFLFDLLSPGASLASLRRAFEARFAPRRITHAQLHEYATRLYRQGLVTADRAGQGAELINRDDERRGARRRQSWLSLLAVRLGGIAAGPAVDRLYRVVQPAFAPAGIVAAVGLVIAAAGTLLVRGAEAATDGSQLATMFTPQRLPLWLGTIVAVKIVHELGHALVLRHFGGECREAGVLLLAGLPTLYCDASDAWKLADKRQRILVGAGGMIAELLLAAAAIVAWRFTQPGLMHHLTLAVAVVASAGTLAVNANPLLRYDGYHILADWCEVPNMAERSRRLVGGAWRRWLLGEPAIAEPLLAPAKRRALVAYAALSLAYGLVLTTLVIAALVKFTEPYRAQTLAYLAAAAVATGIAAGPVRAIGRVLRDPGARRRLRWPRAVVAMLLAAATTAAVWHWPIVHRVRAPIVVAGEGAQPVFAAAAGAIESRVAWGDEVAEGDLIARLVDPELTAAIVAQEGAVALGRTRVAQLRTLRAAQAEVGRELPQALAELADAEAQLAERRRQEEQLTVRAVTTGRIVAPPRRAAAEYAGESLPSWNGAALESRNAGAWVEPGAPLAVIEPTLHRVAWAELDPADVGEVMPGQTARIALPQTPFAVLTGKVVGVTRRMRAADEASATNRPAPRRQADMRAVYVAEIALDAKADGVLPSARGETKIETSRTTIGRTVLREFNQLFRVAW